MRPWHVPAGLLLGCVLVTSCSRLPLRPDPAAPSATTTPRPATDATTALLQEASAAEARGQGERAAALLERAVRVAPEDPFPWSRLARLRLQQGQAAQAEQLAAKSNRLAGAHTSLRAENWQIIAAARRLAGDGAGAHAAEAEAARLKTR